MPIKSKDVFITGLDQTIKNLNLFKEYLVQETARAIALVGVDLLSKAQPRVPWDTGELRESGLAKIKLGGGKEEIIANGHKDGTITVNIDIITKRRLKNVKTMWVGVEYKRRNKKTGFDIAQYVHEDITSADTRVVDEKGKSIGGPSAVKAGTGPKYLTIPWVSNKAKYIKFIKAVASNKKIRKDIAGATSIKKRRIGKFEVDIVELVHRKIKRVGYWNANI